MNATFKKAIIEMELFTKNGQGDIVSGICIDIEGNILTIQMPLGGIIYRKYEQTRYTFDDAKEIKY